MKWNREKLGRGWSSIRRLAVMLLAVAAVHLSTRGRARHPVKPTPIFLLSRAEWEELRRHPKSRTFMVPVEHDFGAPRWQDIAGNPYSQEFRERFDYAGARIAVTYLTHGSTFMGWLDAEGLKPNFAYQLKLRGDWADRAAFERIGYLGRWRLPAGGTNFRDSAYDDYPDKSEVEAYLLFDYFVTDAEGRGGTLFCLQSSLHVLWNDVLNWPPSFPHTPPHAFTAKLLPDAYGEVSDEQPRTVRIWAENEGTRRSRFPVGQARLEPGRYRCDLVLTEESFHSYGDNGGHWATVLSGPVEFTITRPQKE